jgi:hypothetical protein
VRIEAAAGEGHQEITIIHNYEIFTLYYIYFIYSFDGEGPRGADLYILRNVATRCI